MRNPRKGDGFYISGWACHERVSIHASRLPQMVRVGDVIRGHVAFLTTSAGYTEFIVTYVSHWGVWAVPCPEYQKELLKTSEVMKNNSKYYDRTWYPKAKGHHKFKWCHITSIDFKEVRGGGN